LLPQLFDQPFSGNAPDHREELLGLGELSGLHRDGTERVPQGIIQAGDSS
jgi:hypothetical protein